jgi:hypothetical protein
MAVFIIPRVERGRLYFQVANVSFLAFAQAATVRAPAQALPLDIAEPINESTADPALTLVVGGVAWTP